MDDFEKQLNEKAWKDEAFRRQLIASPESAIESLIGQKLRAGMKIVVVEDTADTVHFVLRRKPGEMARSGELTDAALEGAAGGRDRSYVTGYFAQDL